MHDFGEIDHYQLCFYVCIIATLFRMVCFWVSESSLEFFHPLSILSFFKQQISDHNEICFLLLRSYFSDCALWDLIYTALNCQSENDGSPLEFANLLIYTSHLWEATIRSIHKIKILNYQDFCVVFILENTIVLINLTN